LTIFKRTSSRVRKISVVVDDVVPDAGREAAAETLLFVVVDKEKFEKFENSEDEKDANTSAYVLFFVVVVVVELIFELLFVVVVELLFELLFVVSSTEMIVSPKSNEKFEDSEDEEASILLFVEI